MKNGLEVVGVGYHFLSSTSLIEKGRREQEGNGSAYLC